MGTALGPFCVKFPYSSPCVGFLHEPQFPPIVQKHMSVALQQTGDLLRMYLAFVQLGRFQRPHDPKRDSSGFDKGWMGEWLDFISSFAEQRSLHRITKTVFLNHFAGVCFMSLSLDVSKVVLLLRLSYVLHNAHFEAALVHRHGDTTSDQKVPGLVLASPAHVCVKVSLGQSMTMELSSVGLLK